MANWEHRKFTDEQLKKIVSDVFDCKIFTSLQCEPYMVMSVFMPVLFLGARPNLSLSEDNQKNRKLKLQHIDDIIEYEQDTPKREEFMSNIGMIYEYYDKAGTQCINGYPTFFSCHIMSISDKNRFIEMYRKYEEKRKEFEKEFN